MAYCRERGEVNGLLEMGCFLWEYKDYPGDVEKG